MSFGSSANAKAGQGEIATRAAKNSVMALNPPKVRKRPWTYRISADATS